MDEAAAALAQGWFDGGRLAPLGGGRIHETFLVTREEGGRPRRYVLQRINAFVFRDPLRLVDAAARVSEFLNRLAPECVPVLVPAATGPGHADAAGAVWRLWRYVEGARAVTGTRDPALAYAAGAAFGRIERLLEALPAPLLEPSIPGFFDLERDLASLDAASAMSTRAALASDFEQIDARRGLAGRFPAAGRYVHGDCKLGNLLFAAEGAAVRCVLDLDTVMPGHWAWDFGDLARSLLLGAGDARGIELLEAAARGFLDETRLAVAVADLVDAPRYVALALAVRFLADHLQGDVYFRVGAHGENLERARRQLALVERLERDRDRLAAAIGAIPGVEG